METIRVSVSAVCIQGSASGVRGLHPGGWGEGLHPGGRVLYPGGRGSASRGVRQSPLSTGTRKAGGTHPTGMLSCIYLQKA